MKALLIIDMQMGSFTHATPRYDTEGVVERINILSEYFRENGLKVIFIQHDGTKQNEFIPNTNEWEILPQLIRKPTDLTINKTANDSFYKSNLEETLKANNITHLFITGCATDFCVDSTIKSALTKDYEITVIKDGHTTGNRPNIEAKTVVDYYNWLWENMIPTETGIKLATTSELFDKL